MRYWRVVDEYYHDLYKYYLKQGFPEALLRFVCINPYEAYQICTFIERIKPRSMLEIGTFIGLSTGIFSLAKPQDSVLVSVDPNLPVDVLSKRFHYFEPGGSLWFARNMLKHFEKCGKTVLLEGSFSPVSADYRDRLIALGGNPENIALLDGSTVPFAPYDLVFVDGDHHEECVYADLLTVSRSISEDALIILHDLSGYWGIHVFRAVIKFRQEHPEFMIQVHENLGFLYRRSSCISTLMKDLYY